MINDADPSLGIALREIKTKAKTQLEARRNKSSFDRQPRSEWDTTEFIIVAFPLALLVVAVVVGLIALSLCVYLSLYLFCLFLSNRAPVPIG